MLASAVVCWLLLPAAPPPADGLPADWKLVKELPAVTDPDGGPGVAAATLTVAVTDGWMVATLATSGAAPDWQVVLTRATDPKPPAVEVQPAFRGVRVQYGPYFVRDQFGRLRVYRQKKTVIDPAWPVPAGDPKEEFAGSAGNLRMARAGGWSWLTAGAVAGRPDLRVRFMPEALRDSGNGFQTFAGGLSYAFFGEEGTCHEEGDLFVATRVPPAAAEAMVRHRRLRAEFGTKPPPALDARDWHNSAPLALADLKGKVVLLDFWGVWCGPCVAKLPAVQALHDKYKDRGLVVIGVHSADRADRLAEFLLTRKVSIPVALDAGKTAGRYLVEAWPSYFLIDRAGKVVSGFTSEPPTPERIEALLDKKP